MQRLVAPCGAPSLAFTPRRCNQLAGELQSRRDWPSPAYPPLLASIDVRRSPCAACRVTRKYLRTTAAAEQVWDGWLWLGQGGRVAMLAIGRWRQSQAFKAGCWCTRQQLKHHATSSVQNKDATAEATTRRSLFAG